MFSNKWFKGETKFDPSLKGNELFEEPKNVNSYSLFFQKGRYRAQTARAGALITEFVNLLTACL